MKKRIIGAILVIAIFVPFLIIGNMPFNVFMTVLGIVGLYELLRVRESKKEFPIFLG